MRKTGTIKTYLRTQLKSIGVNLANEVGEVGLIYKRKHKFTSNYTDKVTCSRDAADYLRQTFGDGELEYKEFFKVLLMNRNSKIIAVVTVSEGGLSGTVADPKVIFSAALLCNASSVILCHNHPSNQMQPSKTDIALTEKTKKAGLILEIPVLDHIILGPEQDIFFSFADDGIF